MFIIYFIITKKYTNCTKLENNKNNVNVYTFEVWYMRKMELGCNQLHQIRSKPTLLALESQFASLSGISEWEREC